MQVNELQKIVQQELEIYNFNDPFDYERASLNIAQKLANRVIPKIAEVKQMALEDTKDDIANEDN